MTTTTLTFRLSGGAPAFGWYLATGEDGVQYVIAKGEFRWNLSVYTARGVRIQSVRPTFRTLNEARAAARKMES